MSRQGLSKDLCPRRAENIIWREVSGKGILINLADGACFEVSPMGLAIWKQCDGKAPVGAIAERMGRRFHVSPKRVIEDAGSFLKQLKRQKMVAFGG